jgi:hypothetical protein
LTQRRSRVEDTPGAESCDFRWFKEARQVRSSMTPSLGSNRSRQPRTRRSTSSRIFHPGRSVSIIANGDRGHGRRPPINAVPSGPHLRVYRKPASDQRGLRVRQDECWQRSSDEAVLVRSVMLTTLGTGSCGTRSRRRALRATT